MKIFVLLPLAAFAASCTAGAGEPVELSAAEQTELEIELRGRVAEPTRSCVSSRDLRGNRSVGEGVLIFDGPTRDVIYVNRPAGGCPDLRQSRALLTRTPAAQLCRGDIATVFDPVSNIQYGGCGLGDFTPYRRVR
jgi:hypothetical protein